MSGKIFPKASQLLSETNLARLQLSGADTTITAITADSRQVKPGTLFAALPGSKQDGTSFIPQALEAGASGILLCAAASFPMADNIALFSHPEPRLALAHLAKAFYGKPGDSMQLIAITGTNGKTTVAAMLEAILIAGDRAIGVIGTTGIRWPNHHHANPLTTPDPVMLQDMLHRMHNDGCNCAAVEVSSHALDQQRVAGLDFHAAIFTNLSRDHLDYHKSEAEYFAAKTTLFLDNPPPFAIINLDDPNGLELYKMCPPTTEKIGFSSSDPRPGLAISPQFQSSAHRLSYNDCKFALTTPNGTIDITLPAVGRFNIANATAAAAGAWSMGIDNRTIANGLANFCPQPGRMNTLDHGQPFGVIIDFAHTPDALENLLQTAREITAQGRLITLFGCGGDRDHGKRGLMGTIAAKLSDVVIITDDNPRNEDPAAIRAAIVAGCQMVAPAAEQIIQIASRRAAIFQAINQAQPNDTVLLAGKGHERYQLVGDEKLPFADAEVACECLQQLGFTECFTIVNTVK